MTIWGQLWHTLDGDGRLCALVGVVSLLVAFAATPTVRRLAMRHGATDNPGGRRVHKRITARLGGLAVFAAVVCGCVFGLLVWPASDGERLLALSHTVPILLIGGMVCLFGALDDLDGIPPMGKIAGLACAGLLLGWSGIRIDFVSLPGLGRIDLGWFAIPATMLWVLACTNAINLIDGVDGCSAGVVTISAVAMALFALGLGDATTAMLFAATSGSAAGFLIHNRQPASIFLGDSGSLLLGFLLAASSAVGCTKTATAWTLVSALIALSVPFLDATQSFVRRFRASLRSPRNQEGGRLLQALRATAVADRGHIHHRLLFRGLGHAEVAKVICLVTMLTSLTTLLLLPTEEVHWTAIAATWTAGALVLARLGWLPHLKNPDGEPGAEGSPPSPTVADGPQGRRLAPSPKGAQSDPTPEPSRPEEVHR